MPRVFFFMFIDEKKNKHSQTLWAILVCFCFNYSVTNERKKENGCDATKYTDNLQRISNGEIIPYYSF